MRDVAIKKIVSRLSENKIDLSSMKALDFFAREGDWQTAYYANLVAEIHAWEINPLFESSLRSNLPSNAKIVIGDSHSLASTCTEKFDLIVLDNPQGCYGESYCEHFESLDAVIPLLNDSSILILNVKTKPFNYEDKHEWRQRRNQYYGQDAIELKEDFVLSFYERLLRERGFSTEFSFMEKRPQEEGLSALTMKLTKVKQ